MTRSTDDRSPNPLPNFPPYGRQDAWYTNDSTATWHGVSRLDVSASQSMMPLMETFRSILRTGQLRSTVTFESLEKIGSGGEGYVFRTIRTGADGFSVVSAIKVFSPAIYASMEDYEGAMRRIGHVASTVVRIQHDHLVDILNFYEQDGIRFMVMEWINGFDLGALMSHITRDGQAPHDASTDEAHSLNDVVVAKSQGPIRFRPGVVVHMIRECLAGIAALHRLGVVHGDVKPSNIMLNRTGSTKVIDIGSADSVHRTNPDRVLTPCFAAPEVLLGATSTPQSDLASLGYTLIALLSGRVPFVDLTTSKGLYEAKRALVENLDSLMPVDVCNFEPLMMLCKQLIVVNPKERLQTADIAIRRCDEVNRQLVLASLDCDYGDFLRRWMDQLGGELVGMDVDA